MPRLAPIIVGALALTTPTAYARAQTERATLALPADVVQFISTYAAQDLGLWEREGLEAGFLKPEERLSSYDGLSTDDFLH